MKVRLDKTAFEKKMPPRQARRVFTPVRFAIHGSRSQPGPRNARRSGVNAGTRTTAGHYGVFAHLVAEKAAFYREILTVFANLREQFTIHLRPGEVAQALGRDPEETEESLRQLVDWGNLERSHDSSAVSTVEEFYRARYLYQLSAAGEAAEEALRVFEEALQRPGELQSLALRDISQYLDAMRSLLEAEEPDIAKLHAQIATLSSRFRELTTQAQAFMRGLQNTVELHGVSVQDFLEYKRKLINYIQRFLGDLVLATNEIAARILALEHAGVERQLPLVADRALADVLDRTPEREAQERARWAGRWRGLRRWFIGEAGASQAEILRAKAREAIPALLFTLQSINDRRISRSDRCADWQSLALWFAEAPKEEDMHRLWRAAFGMAPARHLQINEHTLDRRDQTSESPRTSWLDAEPLWLEPRLRKTGRVTPRGQAAAVIDRSAEKAILAKLAADEAAQIERAQRVLATGRRIRLSDLGTLDAACFELLLDLLGQTLSEWCSDERVWEVTSTDGVLTVRFERDPDLERDRASIRTSRGILEGPNCWVTVRSTYGSDAPTAMETPEWMPA